MKGNFPTISVRDIEIQRRENDLVVGTFGRGIYILDDYTPLRDMTPDRLAGEAALFGTRTAFRFSEDNVSYDQGDSDYQAPNPPYGAVFTYYLRDGYRSLEAERKARERAVQHHRQVGLPLDEPRGDGGSGDPGRRLGGSFTTSITASSTGKSIRSFTRQRMASRSSSVASSGASS